MSKVLLIDTDKQPLNPIHPAQARQLLRDKKAAIFRRFPFTLILDVAQPDTPSGFDSLTGQKLTPPTVEPVQPLRLKIDPGSRTTGIALVNDATGEVVFAAELIHRGFQIREALTSRNQLRRGRRNRKTRYRRPPKHEWSRKGNKKPVPQQRRTWLAPSLMSRVHNINTWVKKLIKFAPISSISQELVRFDTQLMRNPDIQGKEYQQGTLAGYETREYLLEKWVRCCAYCGKKDIQLQIEHIHPRAKGGSNSITNLTLSCEKCNVKKGTKDIKDFLKKDSEKLKKILAQAKKPLADTAAVNSTRFKLLSVLKATELPVETGSGGLTKFNRTNQDLAKTHWLDAACVGISTPNKLIIKGVKPLLIKACGHGSRQMCGTNKHGFPIRHRSRKQIHFGFQTGDIINAVVTKGKKVGEYVGRVLCRASGSFDIVSSAVFSQGETPRAMGSHARCFKSGNQSNALAPQEEQLRTRWATKAKRIEGLSYRFCSTIHKKDGYSYEF